MLLKVTVDFEGSSTGFELTIPGAALSSLLFPVLLQLLLILILATTIAAFIIRLQMSNNLARLKAAFGAVVLQALTALKLFEIYF